MLMRLLRSHLRPYRNVLLLVTALQAVQTTAALTLPTVTAYIIDQGVLAKVPVVNAVTGQTTLVVQPDQGYVARMGAVMLLLTVVQIVFNIGAVFYGSRIAMRFGRDVRARVFGQVLDFSAREVGTFGAPSLITRVTNDVQQVQMLVVMGCTMLIAAPITMIVGVVMALREDVDLSVVLLVSMPASIIVLGSVVSRMVPAYRVMQERIDQVNRVLREQITGLRVVRAFVREPQEAARFEQANTDLTETSLRAGRLMSAMFPTVGLLVNVSSVGVLWVGAYRVGSGSIEVGSLIAYLSYLVQILMAVVMATFMVSMIPRAAVSADRIQEVLDTEPSVKPSPTPVSSVVSHGALEFDHVGFHYPGAESAVLSDISFATSAGQTTAIVGSTGAGKSTLINLIPRLFDATDGTVRVDGVDVRDLDPDILWGSVGLVPQKAYLFSGTIASNLEHGKPDATEAEMWEALTVAQAADFVRAMPGGLSAKVEQGGSNLSGGQRQRLSIARALIRKPEIYLFDDAFSALDVSTDARLRAALKPYTADAAVVIVAQRVSTIMSADTILVLEDGRLIGQGDHDHLLATCPTYAEIVQSQIGERETVTA